MLKIHAVLEQVQIQLLTTTKLKQQAGFRCWGLMLNLSDIFCENTLDPLDQNLRWALFLFWKRPRTWRELLDLGPLGEPMIQIYSFFKTRGFLDLKEDIFVKQALASMGDLGLQKCTLTSLESRIEVQINEALERIHRFQAGLPKKSFLRIFKKR